MRRTQKLTALSVQRAKKPGYYSDGEGLYLQVSPALTKSWIFRYTLNGRAREMGLGSLSTFSLAEARERGKAQRQLLADGLDPIDARDALKRTAVAEAARIITFDQAAAAYIEAKEPEWKNAKHGDQWRNTLKAYASPKIGAMNIADVQTEHVMSVLRPIWTTKTETATRLRGRLEKIIDWATPEHREGPNPARWRGHLDKKLADPNKIAPVENHPSLPYAQTGAFMRDLRAMEGVSPLAAEFIILTAVRTNEALLAQWSELDLDAALWVIPKERMKGRKNSTREHRVPLSRQALRVLERVKALGSGPTGYVFPGRKKDAPQTNMACLAVLKRMGRSDLTIHGFRSTFRTWAAEQTNFPRDVAEMALGHVIADKVEAAYQRGDMFAKRAKLMQSWADYCGRVQQDAKVLPLEGNRAGRNPA